MSVSLIIFIVIHLLALIFFAETMRRITLKHREYPLEDDERTLPFGFLKLRYVLIFYIVTYVLWIFFTIWLYAVYIDPSISLFNGSVQSGGTVLDL